jgi:hypothetical protein
MSQFRGKLFQSDVVAKQNPSQVWVFHNQLLLKVVSVFAKKEYRPKPVNLFDNLFPHKWFGDRLQI